MKNKKKYKVLFIILGIYIVVILIITFMFKGKNNYVTVMLNNNNKWKYENGQWTNIDIKTIDNYSWQTYKIYNYSNKYIGSYYLLYSNNKWYIFDKNKTAIKWQEGIVALGGDIASTEKTITTVNLDDDDKRYINEVLDENKITDRDNLSTKKRYDIDIDNNGLKERFYVVSNVFFPDTTNKPSKLFGFIFMRNKKGNVMLYKRVVNYDGYYKECRPSIVTGLNISKNENYLITSCSYYSTIGTNNTLFKYNSSKFTKIMETTKNNVLTSYD